MRWEKVSKEVAGEEEGKKTVGRKGGKAGPGKKWGHSCASIKNGRLVYVFGGYGKNCQTNDVFVFDTVKKSWSKPKMKGSSPSPRDSHSCTVVGSKMFIYGGTDGNIPLGDLHVLDTVTNTWTKPFAHGDLPAPREGHGAAVINNEIFVYGGCGKTRDLSMEVNFNDVYALHTDSFAWRKVVTTGSRPPPRDSHSCTSCGHSFIVFGGEDGSFDYQADVHILDIESLCWKKLETTGSSPEPRAGSTVLSVHDNMFVFGGFTSGSKIFNDVHILNLKNAFWTKAITMGDQPAVRFSHSLCCIDSEKGVLLLFGGCTDNLEAIDDMFYLHTDMGFKIEKKQYKRRPQKRPTCSNTTEVKDDFKKNSKLVNDTTETIISQPVDLPVPNKVPECRIEIVVDMESTPEPTTASALLEDPDKLSPSSVGNNNQEDSADMNRAMFEGKITDVFEYGYRLETCIEGKPFRGLLFSP